MLLPAINMAKAIVEAVVAETSVEHIVVTSSFATVLNWSNLPNVHWNTSTFEEAVASKNAAFVYCADKELSERIIWENKERKFHVTSICPPMVYGPPPQVIKSMQDLNTSTQVIWSLINGKSSDPVPASGVISGTDVRDVAALHVRAIETAPSVAHDCRLLAMAFHGFNFQHVASLCQSFSDSPEKLVHIKNGGGDPMYEHYASDSSEAEELLGRPFLSAGKYVKDNALKLWEIEAALNVWHFTPIEYFLPYILRICGNA
ncbi:hypothetical protein C8J57DRAFT_1163686 [Mycena rebaudengoi]|nr:hypothetical protein C8J57DRAFT_1163686 [Mycena rebaudengoi]